MEKNKKKKTLWENGGNKRLLSRRVVYSLPNDKILDWSKWQNPDDKIDTTQNLKFGLERIENIVGKG